MKTQLIMPFRALVVVISFFVFVFFFFIIIIFNISKVVI
jgi:hypothetical protein